MEDSRFTSEAEYEGSETNAAYQYTQPRKKERVLLGLIGAVIGTVPGIIVWVIIGQLGFVASISGALIALGAFYGYELLGKGTSIIGVILSGITILAAVFAAICLNYIVDIMKYYQTSLTDSIELLKIMVRSLDDFRPEFIKATALGYLFALIGSARIISRKFSARAR